MYAHIPKDEGRKLDPKSKKCILLGYGTETKGYRLYDPQSSRVMYSRDVKFNESEFGFEKNPGNEVQADKRATLELSSEKEESKEDQVDNVEFIVRPLSTMVITQQLTSIAKPYRTNISKLVIFYNACKLKMI